MRKIKILVLIAPDGTYNSAGYGVGNNNAEYKDLDYAWDGLDTNYPDSDIKKYWVEVEIPLPSTEIPVIKGKIDVTNK